MQPKTSCQRMAKGPVRISDCSLDGKVIVLENTSRLKDRQISNWVLRRCVDNKKEITYKFPVNFTLKAGMNVNIWALGHGLQNLPTDLVNMDRESWGIGDNIVTSLFDEIDDEKATHLQRTVYAE